MKIILTGSSGFIGQEVLLQTLSHPSITSIVALSRKPLPETFTSNPKLQVVVLEDFENYTPEVLAHLSGAEACIWTIGAKSTNPAVTQKVSIDYTLAAATACTTAQTLDSKFRFVFVSGIVAVRDQDATVFIYSAARKIAGLSETKIIDFANKLEGFETYIARPAGVTAQDGNGIMSVVMGLLPRIGVDQLAAALVQLAVSGDERQTFGNRDLVSLGRQVLADRT